MRSRASSTTNFLPGNSRVTRHAMPIPEIPAPTMTMSTCSVMTARLSTQC
ncbi:Uncharacterised protein [Mycobacteroides abscessus subsp. abscessus]|nr:Uncharacterised protein [Mycobacteroides abscessus subsp. abscessus]SKU79872.1 Uncharacterised protein [Mycobacteroides abscessus subsp. abscessus]